MKKILFIDRVHPYIPEELNRRGFICEFHLEEGPRELKQIAGQYFGMIIRSRFRADRDFLASATNLKFIGRVGSGMDSIDTAYAAERGILCLNSPEGNRDAVGEHTLGMILSLLNHFNRADRQVREGKWDREGNKGLEIKGKTIGIIGYGNMGSAFAQRLNGFEAIVISYDKYKKDYSDGNTRETSLEEIFSQSDIVSLHIPLTDETKYMADKEFFTKFRKNIWLANTSRGPVVKTSDLVESLKSGKVLGAALDVLEYEEVSFEKLTGSEPEELRYLKQADQVILTPHIAGSTLESPLKLATFLVDKILKAFPDAE